MAGILAFLIGLAWPHLRVFQPQEDFAWPAGVAFSPDSRWLASCAGWTPPHLWPLEAGLGGNRTLDSPVCLVPTFDPKGERLLVSSHNRPVAVVPVAGGKPQILEEIAGGETVAVAFDAEGRLAAAGPHVSSEEDRVLRVWDLESGGVEILDLLEECRGPGEPYEQECGVWALRFAPDGTLYSAGDKGIRRWDLASGRAEWLYRLNGGVTMDLSSDGRFLVAFVGQLGVRVDREILWFDLGNGTRRRIASHGREPMAVALDASGRILVSGDRDGTVRVGPASGGEPHLLLGHKGQVNSVAVSADGRWIASASYEEIRVWPMPNLSKPPLHTLPHDELLATLRSLTNLRVVEDEDSSIGYRLEVGPFPGWEKVPVW